MKVNYKVVGYRPDYEWIEVEFTHPDQPDQAWVRRFNFPDFSRRSGRANQGYRFWHRWVLDSYPGALC